MACDYCDKDATLHLTQVVEGEIRKVHLCEACAAEMGVDPEAALSVTDLLLNLGKEPMEPKAVRKESAQRCPDCGLTRSKFKKTGRMGCGTCYAIFHAHLKPIIESMHQSVQHLGRVPADATDAERAVVRTADLQVALDRSIADERYEEAVTLRDDLEHWQGLLTSETEAGA